MKWHPEQEGLGAVFGSLSTNVFFFEGTQKVRVSSATREI